MKKNLSLSQRIAVYPGSFDPVTRGHLDLVERACRLFDKVVVAVAIDSSKKATFSVKERTEMLQDVLSPLIRRKQVEVHSFRGLLVRYARQVRASAVVRGLRAIADFEYEFQMALMNRHLAPQLETVFLMPDERYIYISSSLVREMARLGGNIKPLVSASVERRLRKHQNLFRS